MNRRHSSHLFQYVSSDPNPNVNPTLWEHRLRQWRPISRNPFEEESTGYGPTALNTPSARAVQSQSYNFGGAYPNNETQDSSGRNFRTSHKDQDIEWGEQIPSWLNLFDDLAWTATFSCLTSNNKFREPWDSVSYVTFFTTGWWLWVSQMFYNIDFYTDDWFHLLFIFLQLLTFGALAATTRGFDVRNYITQSPGATQLVPYDIMTATPERYGAERLAKISLRVITFVLAISRILLLIQHLRVVIYAKFTSKSGRFPHQLLIVPASLFISTILFFGAFAISQSQSGKEPYGAKIKFVLWGVALLVEVIAQVVRSQMDITEGVRLRSRASVLGRLNDITTIILGEGTNAIAGTLYAVEKAPGFSKSTATGIVCCGIIVFFLAYLYFEGAAPLKPVRRRAAWVMMHLPWLLSVILLLEGVKNQLLLSNFLNSAEHIRDKIGSAVGESVDEAQLNATMRPLLLQAGLSYDEQYGNWVNLRYNDSRYPNITKEVAVEIQYVWYLRVQLLATFNTYQTFVDKDFIPETIHSAIRAYMDDYNLVAEDAIILKNESDTRTPHLLQLWEYIADSHVDNARYIVALCSATFIFLATLNLIQELPKDRFHWASIFSRYAMGACILLLLLLNIGKNQHLYVVYARDESQQAGLLRWIDAGWVLPTLALAYAIQFIIDTVLVYCAVRSSNRAIARIEVPKWFT